MAPVLSLDATAPPVVRVPELGEDSRGAPRTAVGLVALRPARIRAAALAVVLALAVALAGCAGGSPAEAEAEASDGAAGLVAPDARGAPVLTGSAECIDGRPVDLDALRGRVTLLVNTASRCGSTPQLGGLQTLHDAHARADLTVLGVPSGDFAGQEFAENAENAEFCS